MDWTNKKAVREYKRLQQRRYRGSTRTQEKLGLDWKDRLAVNAYKRKKYTTAKYSKWFRWRAVVTKFLGPIPAVRSLGRPAVRKP